MDMSGMPKNDSPEGFRYAMDSGERGSFTLQEEIDPETLKRYVNTLYGHCLRHNLGEPFVMQVPAGTNKKTAEALRARGFIVLYPGEYLDKNPWDLPGSPDQAPA